MFNMNTEQFSQIADLTIEQGYIHDIELVTTPDSDTMLAISDRNHNCIKRMDLFEYQTNYTIEEYFGKCLDDEYIVNETFAKARLKKPRDMTMDVTKFVLYISLKLLATRQVVIVCNLQTKMINELTFRSSSIYPTMAQVIYSKIQYHSPGKLLTVDKVNNKILLLTISSNHAVSNVTTILDSYSPDLVQIRNWTLYLKENTLWCNEKMACIYKAGRCDSISLKALDMITPFTIAAVSAKNSFYILEIPQFSHSRFALIALDAMCTQPIIEKSVNLHCIESCGVACTKNIFCNAFTYSSISTECKLYQQCHLTVVHPGTDCYARKVV